jgi:hypothetical protein
LADLYHHWGNKTWLENQARNSPRKPIDLPSDLPPDAILPNNREGAACSHATAQLTRGRMPGTRPPDSEGLPANILLRLVEAAAPGNRVRRIPVGRTDFGNAYATVILDDGIELLPQLRILAQGLLDEAEWIESNKALVEAIQASGSGTGTTGERHSPLTTAVSANAAGERWRKEDMGESG